MPTADLMSLDIFEFDDPNKVAAPVMRLKAPWVLAADANGVQIRVSADTQHWSGTAWSPATVAASVSVGVSNPVSYQWGYLDGGGAFHDITGAVSASFTVDPAGAYWNGADALRLAVRVLVDTGTEYVDTVVLSKVYDNEALAAAQAAQATADAATKTWMQAGAPAIGSRPDAINGDRWLDTDDGSLYEAVGGVWLLQSSDVPLDPVGYWPLDEVPDMPDDPTGAASISHFASDNDGWAANGNTLSYPSPGIMRVTGGALIYKDVAAMNGKKHRVRVRMNRSASFLMLYYNGTTWPVFKNVTVGTEWTNVDGLCASGSTNAVLYIGYNGWTSGDWFEIDTAYSGTATYTTPAIDASGRGRHLTLRGPTPMDVAARRALVFDGGYDWVTKTFDTPTEIRTLRVRARVVAPANWCALVSTFAYNGGSSGSGMALCAHSTTVARVLIGRTGANYQYADIAHTWDTATEHDYAVVVNADRTISFYVDGLLKGTTTAFDTTVNLVATGIILGKWALDYSGYYLSMEASHAVAYARALTAKEVRGLWLAKTLPRAYNLARWQVEQAGSDGTIMPAEKTTLLSIWRAIDDGTNGSYRVAKAKAAAAGVSTTALDNARDALYAYLFGTPGVLAPVFWGSPITISAATYQTLWTTYYNAEVSILDATSVARETAITTSITNKENAVPANVASIGATAYPGDVYVSWPAVDKATSYLVSRSSDSGSTWNDWAIVNTNWFDDLISASIPSASLSTYRYRVKAISFFGVQSAAWATMSAAPTIPAAWTVTPVAPTCEFSIAKRTATIKITPQADLVNPGGWDVQISKVGGGDVNWWSLNLLAKTDAESWGLVNQGVTNIKDSILTIGFLPITTSGGLPLEAGETYYFRVRARCANPVAYGAWTTSAALKAYPTLYADLAAGAVQAATIAAGAVGLTAFASGMRPVRIVASLPASPWTGYTTGDVVMCTGDSHMYRFTGSGWTCVTASTEITGTLTSSQIADLAAAKITGTLTETQIGDDTISSGKIKAGAVITAKLAAGAVTAEKLSIGSGVNLVPYAFASFEASPAGTVPGVGAATLTHVTAAEKAFDGQFSLKIITDATNTNGWIFFGSSDTDYNIKLEPSTRYVLSAWMYLVSSAAVQVQFHLKNQAGTYFSGSPVLGTIGVWTRVKAVVTTDAATTGGIFRLDIDTASATVYVDCIQVEKAPATSTEPSPWVSSGLTTIYGGLVQTGTVSTQCLYASWLTAGAISAGAITANELASNAVTATKIAAGAISAEKLSVVAKNRIHNPSWTGNVWGWGGLDEYGGGSLYSGVAFDLTEGALALTTTANLRATSRGFEVDHSKIYRVRCRMKKSAAVGEILIGLVGSTAEIASSGGTSNGEGTELFTPYPSTDRLPRTAVTNFYAFDYTSTNIPTSYVDIEFFICGAYRDFKEVPHYAYGALVLNSAKMAATTRYVALRVLSWINGGTSRTYYVRDISVSEVGSGTIVADNILANTITAGKLNVSSIDVDTGAANFVWLKAGLVYAGANASASDTSSVGGLPLVAPSSYAGKWAMNYFDLDNAKFRVGDSTKYLRYDTTNGLRIVGTFALTAGDTANVNGVSAATVQGGAAKANLGLDVNGYLTSKVLPGVNASPSATGLYMGKDYLGFYNSGWKIYMQGTGTGGKFYAGDGGEVVGTNKFIKWDTATGKVTISGEGEFTGTLKANSIATSSAIYSSDGHLALNGDAVTNTFGDGLVFASYNQISGSPGSTDIKASTNLFSDVGGGHYGIVEEIRVGSSMAQFPRLWDARHYVASPVMVVREIAVQCNANTSATLELGASTTSPSAGIKLVKSGVVDMELILNANGLVLSGVADARDLGTSTYKWRNGYFSGLLLAEGIHYSKSTEPSSTSWTDWFLPAIGDTYLIVVIEVGVNPSAGTALDVIFRTTEGVGRYNLSGNTSGFTQISGTNYIQVRKGHTTGTTYVKALKLS